MRHSWSKPGTYKDFEDYDRGDVHSGNVLICNQCGIIQRKIQHGYRNFVTFFYRSDLIAVKKTPICDNIWPGNWKPACIYTMIIGAYDKQNKTFVRCDTFDDAKKHMLRYGIPAKIKTQFFRGNESVYSLLEWMIASNTSLPPDFSINITDGKFYKPELYDDAKKVSAGKIQLSMDLARGLNEIAMLCRDDFFLEKL